MKKYLISGIPPSQSGVGYLMVNLEKIALKHNYDVIYPSYVGKSIRQSLFNPFKVITELWSRYTSKKEFIYTIKKIKDSEVILLHPQTIGYDNFINLIKKNHTNKIYIMDNSFFCIKSYNTLNGNECLKCLTNLDDCDSLCMPFPINYDRKKNIEYLKQYKELTSKILFYSQNNQQEELLKIHFGRDIRIKRVGLITAEVFEKELVKKNLKYDIVYHATNHEAKGIYYVIELAKYLAKYKILIPDKKEAIAYSGVFPENIIFERMSWNTGLKEAVINTRLVLNPSIWSPPIEGALLKSIYYNGNVGIPKTKYGFINDIPIGCILALTNDVEESSNIIENFFNSNSDLSALSQNWLSSFLNNECNLESLFENDYQYMLGEYSIPSFRDEGEVIKNTLTSIITVVYNGECFLEKTIQSVLNQTYKNIEYIIIDGGSTDGTLDLIKKYENEIDYWVSEKDSGIYDAMNKGIKVANGEFINFLNAGDDFFENNVLENIFTSDCSSYDLIYGSAVVVDANRSKEILLLPKAFTRLNLLFWTTRVVCHQSIFVNKNVILPYTDKFKLKGELYWYFDLSKKCKKYLKLNEPIVYYSLGGTGDVNYKLNTIESIKVVFSKNGMLGFISLPVILFKLIRKILK